MIKRLLFTIVFWVLILAGYSVFAQTQKDTTRIRSSGMDPVEVVPEFPGGFEALNKFLDANIKTIEGASGKRAIVTFVVEKDGTLTEIKVVRGINEAADQEAVRVMKLSPKWKPASQNGILYRSAYSIPIKFN